MKFPYSWLKSYFTSPPSAKEVEAALNEIGLEVEHVEHVGDAIHFGVGLTPNLAHCNSVRGIARELGAYFDQKIISQESSLEEQGEKAAKQVTLKVESEKHCPHYSCRLIKGVKVTPSPDWLVARIEACGMRSVNCVVDVTNLIMLDIGQPLHAFDFAKIEGGEITLRPPHKGEEIALLDGSKHHPSDEMLLVCDARKPVAIAGVMGSLESEVSETTTTVLLESAYFEPTQVRRTSKRTGIQSEASYRFERGVDPLSLIEALDRAAALIAELSGGKVAPGVVEVQSAVFEPRKVSCRLGQVNRILGTKLAMNEVTELLRRIDLKVLTSKQETMTVAAPPYRHDIHHEIDLIEEIARFYGYNNLKSKEQPLYRTGELGDAPQFLFEKEVRSQLLRAGLTECITCDLISPTQAEMMLSDQFPKSALIHLLNPRSQEQSILRPSLMPGLLAVVKHNRDHGNHAIGAFEIGRIHFKSKDESIEQSAASIVLCGKLAPSNWKRAGEDADFFALKGIVENLFDHLRIKEVAFQPSSYPCFHPHRQAALSMGGMEVGVMGEIHPAISGVEVPIYFAELHLEDLCKLVGPSAKMTPLALYPGISLDWTLTLAEEVSAANLFALVEKYGDPLLKSASVLDLYHGEKVGSGWKNITLRFIYRDQQRTIAHQVAQEGHAKMTSAILEELKGKVRS